MDRLIPNIDLVPNVDELFNQDGMLLPELEMAAHVLHACGLGILFTKKDFKEFITRTCLVYGLLNPQETYFNEDHFLTAEIKETGEQIFLNPKTLIRYVGLIAIQGRLYSCSREELLKSLTEGQKTRIWTEVFSPFKIHNWEDKNTPDGEVRISASANVPDLTAEHIRNAEAFAEFVVKEYDDAIFTEFWEKNKPLIKVLRTMEWEEGSVKFDIRDISKDFLRDFILALRDEKYFNEEAFEAYDEDEYNLEFNLMKLAWAVANGYAEYIYHNNQPADMRIDNRLEFDYDNYEGLHHDDFGGINLLQTYIDFGLESVVIYLQDIAPLVEQMRDDSSDEPGAR